MPEPELQRYIARHSSATGLPLCDTSVPPRHAGPLGTRGLLPAFPDGFPVPDDAEPVLAQFLPDGGQHIAWRRDGTPFTGYPQRLRAIGCDLGPCRTSRSTGVDTVETVMSVNPDDAHGVASEVLPRTRREPGAGGRR